MTSFEATQAAEAIALYCDARDLFARGTEISERTKAPEDARAAADAYAKVLEGQERMAKALGRLNPFK